MQLKDKKINVLIISYFFQPDKVVGALRTSYWYNKFMREDNFEVQVITSNIDAKGDGVYVVEQKSKFKWYNLIKDLGLLWRKQLSIFFNKNIIAKPDVVIISGSPFLHFDIGIELKKKFNCKILLDYRDPFADNPGFNSSIIKKKVKLFYEKRFNKYVDGLITVNDFCASLIHGFNSKRNLIVQNGYDETFQPILKKIDRANLSFCYTGKFYFDPSPIIKSIHQLNLSLTYVGPSLIDSSEGFVNSGFVDYKESVNIIANSDVGIIQTYGEDFQSTTKIFDYLRCRKIILIVSDLYMNQGSIHEELKNYPNVYWSKNNQESIIEVLKEIQITNYVSPEKGFEERFSREFQYDKLVKFINEIND